jgi:hypothetical protein
MKQDHETKALRHSSVSQSLWSWFKALRAPGKLGVIEIMYLIVVLGAAVIYALVRSF